MKAHADGADILLLRGEMVEKAERQKGVEDSMERLKYATSSDD